MGRRVASLLDIGQLLPEMVEQLRRVLAVEIVSVMLVEEGTETLRIAAASGLPQDVVRHARVPFGEGISGQVAQRGEPILVRDMAQHPELTPSAYSAQYTTQSLLCVPLRVGDRVLGVVNVNNKLSGEPLQDEDLLLVSTFCAQAALALENSRLYGRLESEVLRVTAELRASNAELRSLQEFNESILGHMSSGLVVLDLEGRVTKLNAAGAALLGVPDGPVEETLESLFGAAAAARMRAGGESERERHEALVSSRHGREALIGWSASELRGPDGRPAGTIVIFRDLTQVKKMEAELVRMDRMASLGVLGAGIAHEIRNPLAAIRFNLDFLSEGGRSQEIDVIVKNVERLDDLVNELLRFARPQQPSFEAEPLNGRVEAVVALINKQAEAAGVEVRTALDRSLPDAWIDGPQVEQVVLNVALNGIQAMPRGGTLQLVTRRTSRDGREHVELRVTDEGEGLPPGGAGQIFDPFFTTRREGTGLGLAVAQRIMGDHGGWIDAAPREDGRRGTTFSLAFPVASDRGGRGGSRSGGSGSGSSSGASGRGTAASREGARAESTGGREASGGTGWFPRVN
jgi:PAS domain S-box-containing protein